jgi:hypothetical protein
MAEDKVRPIEGGGYDDFLNAATVEIARRWQARGGPELDVHDLYELNDLLDDFFDRHRSKADDRG